MFRLAALSDIHGNRMALEAVLADLEAQGRPDALWVLGDLAAFCPWPAETLARLRALPDAAFLQGNTDRYLVTGCRPAMSIHTRKDWEIMPTRLAEREASFRWTVERLSYADYEFLRDLPDRLGMEVPGYGRIAAVHANAKDDESFLTVEASDEELQVYFSGLDGRALLYGHTHCPVDRMVGSVRIVNDGSVGLPLDGDPRPAYALLDFEGDVCTLTIRRVPYDREAVAAELARVSHPDCERMSRMLRDARL